MMENKAMKMTANKYEQYVSLRTDVPGYLVKATGLEGIQARVVAASVSNAGKKLTTLELRYPKFIHSELMTHRQFSRNASSSRAIPVETFIEQATNNPATPIHWGVNQSGMQAKEEQTDEVWAKSWWHNARDYAVLCTKDAQQVGLHKQIANRILEPWQYITTLVSATEWGNFFSLRVHPAAQPELQMLAVCAKLAMDAVVYNQTKWHLPYISEAEKEVLEEGALKSVSVARCCRVSYLRHGEGRNTIDDDIELANTLLNNGHFSPLEHVAVALKDPTLRSGNFEGWHQYRQIRQMQMPVKTVPVPLDWVIE